ncbi:acyl-ACP--UDP-N-acetylglucosamine O-acyltransferase [Breoghania sp. L-A4]|uniref:acyl-ACP--UDP-N-acetylglucosamine O-acyltransferase n=1 Tax=Breoghania sp. L-A4 TaxID=2304600 RepID=UPI000E360202|nr:acyl-ACP--UDP-N-acetylglucosamine O-acyltransferase [Breoghania sp. L-A4]AXS40418.1 acyl-ACP--UDP-N-acetylglucosamine O-acyltransferase [Breoghania sp. L-A4]
MTTLHSTAVVDPGATIGAGVEIGPFCVVGPNVTLGDGVVLTSHVVVEGHTDIGPGTRIFPFASIGHAPQDLKFGGEVTRLVIGAKTVIREHVTMNPGTAGGGGLTEIGDNCLIMVGAHVAHDCRVGNNVILVNNATLGGHVVIGDHVIVGGLTAVHQFVRIGKHAMIGGMSGIETDVIPYGSAIGNRAYLGGLNLVGLRRRNMPREDIHGLRAAYKALFEGEGTLSERAATLRETAGDNTLIRDVVDFILADSDRNFCTPRGAR